MKHGNGVTTTELREWMIAQGVIRPRRDVDVPEGGGEGRPYLALDDIGRAAAMRPLSREEERQLTRWRPSGGAIGRWQER